MCRGHAQTQLLVPNSSFCSRPFRSGSWVFLVSLYLLSRICLGLPKHIVIFSPIWFLCILLLEERCVQVQAKGLRSQPVSGLLKKFSWKAVSSQKCCSVVRLGPENEIYQGSESKTGKGSMFLSSHRPGNECPLESFHRWC